MWVSLIAGPKPSGGRVVSNTTSSGTPVTVPSPGAYDPLFREGLTADTFRADVPYEGNVVKTTLTARRRKVRGMSPGKRVDEILRLIDEVLDGNGRQPVTDPRPQPALTLARDGNADAFRGWDEADEDLGIWYVA